MTARRAVVDGLAHAVDHAATLRPGVIVPVAARAS